jgi:anti-anti-sigma factor
VPPADRRAGLEREEDEALALAGELQDRIRRERATVRALKEHVLAVADAAALEPPRLQAPTRSTPGHEGDEGTALGECLRLWSDRTGPDDLRVRLAGEVDLAGAVRLRAFLADQLGQGVREVLLDLGDVSFVDSNGLSALLWLRRQVLLAGGHLLITAVHPQLVRLLSITGLRGVLLPG